MGLKSRVRLVLVIVLSAYAITGVFLIVLNWGLTSNPAPPDPGASGAIVNSKTISSNLCPGNANGVGANDNIYCSDSTPLPSDYTWPQWGYNGYVYKASGDTEQYRPLDLLVASLAMAGLYYPALKKRLTKNSNPRK